MSLTSLLSDPEVRYKLREHFPTPPFTTTLELRAAPVTRNYSLVGTAFDYLLRFYLGRRFKSRSFMRTSLVADEGFLRIMTDVSTPKLAGIGNTLFYRSRSRSRRDKKHLLRLLSEQYGQAKANYLSYYSNGVLTDDFIRSTLFLARLDCYYRGSGREGINFFQSIDKDDIKDLRRLISLVGHTPLIDGEECYLNPTFGKASELVYGADADIIVDNTLIEIKVTRSAKLPRRGLDQLIGYYILSLIGGINGDRTNRPIKNIGIYFARHGYLWTMPISSLARKKEISIFKDWFVDYAKKYYSEE